MTADDYKAASRVLWLLPFKKQHHCRTNSTTILHNVWQACNIPLRLKCSTKDAQNVMICQQSGRIKPILKDRLCW